VASADSFEDLMAGLRAGEPAARAAVFERFASRLVALAENHLDSRLRGKADPEDVLDSVYRTFFRRSAQGQFTFDGWGGLWRLLTVITLRKCARLRRHLGGEVALDAGREELPAEYIAREPIPLEAAALAELTESLVRGMGPRDAPIVWLRLQGHTPREIAAQLDRPQRTVFRVLQRAKQRLQRLCDKGREEAT
jgi:RNA polymerase sigma-70 factor (ECF subfamily)